MAMSSTELRQEALSALSAATMTMEVESLYLELRIAKTGRTSVKSRKDDAVCPAELLMQESIMLTLK